MSTQNLSISQNAAKLMISAGGTGGHVFPAIAVAKELRARGVDISWLGTKRGLEARVVPENNIPIHWVTVEGLRGKSLFSLMTAPFNLLRAIWQSRAVLKAEKPDCVLGMGGFVAGPTGLAAKLLGIPLVIHEQNAVAGLTNSFLAKIASRALSGFPNVEGLPKKTIWLGNPVRSDIVINASDSKVDATSLNVLVVGGSQGAYSFNAYLPKAFSNLALKNLNIWHQSGRGNQVAVEQLYSENRVEAKVAEFIDDMASAYRWSDVLICRAGAMTIAECSAAGKAALLVPYPFSAGDHQDFNAQALVDVGAAIKVDNSELAKSAFTRVLNEFLSDREKLLQMGVAAKALFKPNATKDVADVCEEYLNA